MHKYVIFTADDFGLTRGVNRGICEVVEAGILTSTTVMTNFPYYQEIHAIKDKIGVGVHLTLTEGTPVLNPGKIPTLVDEKGNFYDHQELIKKVYWRKLSIGDVEAEFDAQIRQLVDIGIKPSHIDSHESILKYPFFISIAKRLAEHYDIRGVRTYSPRIFDYNRLKSPKRILISLLLLYQKAKWVRSGFHVTDKIDSLIEFGLDYGTALGKLKDILTNASHGVLEIIVHPGYDDEERALLGGYVYEREAELKALLNGEVKKIIEESGMILINYNDIAKR